MKTILLAALLGAFFIATATALVVPRGRNVDHSNHAVLNKDFVAVINSLTNGQWTATENNGRKFRHATLPEVSRLMGVHSLDNSELSPRQFTAGELAAEIPEEFDAFKQWPECPTIAEIRDQSNCGSCWAIAAASAMSDRYCVVGKKPNVRVATGDLLSCCFVCGSGCYGGWPTAAWSWWTWVGLTTEDCQPYPFPPCGHHTNSERYPACPSAIYDTPTCNATCTDQSVKLVRYKGKSSYSVSGEEAYQRELMANGPFEVALDVYADFVAYKSGVYSHTIGSKLGGHAVRIVGWGIENGVKYWRIANSWNEDWGDKGYIRIKRGSNECGIEQSGTAGLPLI